VGSKGKCGAGRPPYCILCFAFSVVIVVFRPFISSMAAVGESVKRWVTWITVVLSRAITNSGTNHFIERFSYVVLNVVRLNSALTLGIGNPHLRQRKSAAGVGTLYSC
jgi:cytochrome c biogenesis protein CcdA